MSAQNTNTFFHFDKKRWPIIVLTINGKPKDDNEFDLFLEKWKLVYVESMTKGERYKLIFDTRKAEKVKLEYLIKLGTWLKDIQDLTEKWMDKTAIIVSNQGIKLIIKFVFTLYKAVRPFKTFEHGELANAITWLNDKDDKGELDNFDVSSEGMDDELKNNLIKQQFRLQ